MSTSSTSLVQPNMAQIAFILIGVFVVVFLVMIIYLFVRLFHFEGNVRNDKYVNDWARKDSTVDYFESLFDTFLKNKTTADLKENSEYPYFTNTNFNKKSTADLKEDASFPYLTLTNLTPYFQRHKVSQIDLPSGYGTATYTYSTLIYNPVLERLYFTPLVPALSDWYYIDAVNNTFQSYTHGASIGALDYFGSVYSPTQKRIYLVPYFGSGTIVSDWHYIDCNSGSVVSYTHGVSNLEFTDTDRYNHGAYSPKQNRIYFCPHLQYTESKFHYVDCSDGSITSYAHGLSLSSGFLSMVYSPNQNRIYVIPQVSTNWHYIDCSDGSWNAIDPGFASVATNYAYSGGIYDPVNDRIYLVPTAQTSYDQWHYINCTNGNFIAYTAPSGLTLFTPTDVLTGNFIGGVYHPLLQRIYFTPSNHATEDLWVYIDCAAGGTVHTYAHGLNLSSGTRFHNGCYNPNDGYIYFVPAGANSDTLVRIGMLTNPT